MTGSAVITPSTVVPQERRYICRALSGFKTSERVRMGYSFCSSLLR
jgi:hypothetical protein